MAQDQPYLAPGEDPIPYGETWTGPKPPKAKATRPKAPKLTAGEDPLITPGQVEGEPPSKPRERRAAKGRGPVAKDQAGGSVGGAAPPAGYGRGLIEKGGLADKLKATLPPAPPSVPQDITQYLAPYLKELTNLGPEYGAEMEYLKPYLMPGHETMAGLQSQAAADTSPTGSKSVQAAGQALGQAAENMPTPGFGNIASMAKQYAQSVPYSDILSTLLNASKSEILGYQNVPNLQVLTPNVKTWPSNVQQAYQYATSGIGYNPSTGMPGTSFLQGQTPTGTSPTAPTNPATQPVNPTSPYQSPQSSQGGGNV